MLAACRGDELPVPAPPAQGTSILTLTVDAASIDTRSTPEAGDPDKDGNQLGSAQHVQNVKLYIFQGSGAQATYIGMDGERIWKDLTTVKGGNPVGNQGGQETTSKYYTVQTELEPNTTYTLLGVAYEGEDIYDIILPASEEGGTDSTLEQLGEEEGVQGVLDLSRLYSVLKNGKGKTDIQQNEYFTGTTTVSTDADGHLPEDTRVTMRRRVAGLSACFELTNFNEKPQAVAIMLWRKQHKDVPTVKRIWQEPFFTDHGERFLPDATENAEPKDLPQCLLWIDALEENQGTKLMPQESARNTAKANGYHANGSAYALPQEAPSTGEEKNYTLAVVVYNKANEVICTKRAALAKDGKLIFATDLGTGIVDDESFYRYPIVANRFYRFGTESQAMEVEFDENNPFEVIVEPEWEGMPDLDFGD